MLIQPSQILLPVSTVFMNAIKKKIKVLIQILLHVAACKVCIHAKHARKVERCIQLSILLIRQ